MTKGRNFDNFSICKLSENIISAYFSIRIQLRLNLHIAEVRSNIQNGKICLEIDYFSIFLLYFFSFQKILLIGHPTYGTFFPDITCTNRSHKLAHDCIIWSSFQNFEIFDYLEHTMFHNYFSDQNFHNLTSDSESARQDGSDDISYVAFFTILRFSNIWNIQCSITIFQIKFSKSDFRFGISSSRRFI